jgi:chromosome segregation ATPase
MNDKVQQNCNDIADHSKSISSANEKLKEHTGTLDKHWQEIEALKKSIAALSEVDPGNGGNIDATAILRKINFVEQQLNDKADKIEVVQARAYSDEKIAEAVKNLEKVHDQIRIEVSNFREDYALFRS